MAFKKIPLTIDTMIRNPVPVEGINQEDNIELNIVVTENKTPKDLSSQTIKVYVRRIDGTLVEQTDQITPTNASKGEVIVKLKNSAFNKEGYALFQLDISDSSGRITSSYATFKIGKGLVSGEAIANTNEIEALKKVEEYIKKANQELETFKQTVAEINENETTRQENEVVRVREEASRNEAEAIRAQQEATRKEKENERVQAEIKRIADEEMRRENEVLRESKELERKQAEELRKETELLRIEDENNRKVAESKRVKAESSRVEAEKLRVTAETGRVEAESLRATAEEERVAAETKREEGFNAFEGRISANTKELKAARSATTGEEFNSLDERIDCEVDRLNKKIEVSFMQQEDKENHVIENTVEGMTTGMVIKGRTLQNHDNYSNKFHSGLILSNVPEKIENRTIKANVGYTFIFTVGEFNGDNDKGGYVYELVYEDGTTKRIYDVQAWANEQGEKRIYFTPAKEIKEFISWNRGKTGSIPITNIMILEGDWTEKPIKYFKGEISFGQQEGKITHLSCGKNLAKLDLSNPNITHFEDGFKLDCHKLHVLKQDIFNRKGKYKENTQYVLSFKGKIIDNSNNNNYRLRIWYTDETYTDGVVHSNSYSKETIKSLGGKTINMISGYYGVMNGDFIVKDVMLEEGTQSTEYEEYKEDKKNILLSDLGFDEGLRGLNNIVYDELSSIKNVAIKRIEKHTMTGNEQLTVKLRGDYIYCNCILKGSVPRSGTEAICNKFIYIDGLWNQDDPKVQNKEGFDLSGGNSLSFQIPISKLENTNEEGIKKYFKSLHDSGNPVIVYYELAEPIETPLDENINLKAFRERTYIGFKNAINGTSSFKAPVDAAATISRLNRENRSLRQDFESTTLSLTDSDLELVKQNVDMDFRLMEVEFALDIPQAILSSNINFKNKKGEVKSRARSPYEMMKIVILSGDYDREDYMHKVGKYYERERMTKEEHDELMSLMKADEVIGG